MSFDEHSLIGYVTRQRWYGAKSRTVAHAQMLDSVVLRTTEPQFALALVEMRYDSGAHDIYQLLYALRDGVLEIEALDEPQLARELVSAMRSGLTLQGAEGIVEFRPVEGFAGLGRELANARSVGAEQSNTSVVFDDELILKVFRRLEAGINPELEMLRFLTEHGFENIAPLGGWYAYSGGPTGATLGILQQFVAGGIDGWGLALEEIANDPDAFLARLERLGEVTGAMHSALASDDTDPAFAPESPSVEALALLTATVDEEIERVFLTLPEDDERIAPILGRGEEVRDQLRLLTHAGSTGKSIRTHGDYHLGQTLWVNSRLEAPSAEPTAPGRSSRAPAAPGGGDWVIIDFEGEPARSLAERRRKRSPLRDVAGMLRSFAYATIAASHVHGTEAPDGWEEQARRSFLDGYLETVDPALLPSGQVAIDRLLSVYELEKAVYELQYELDNRPDWVGIPAAGISRLIDQAATTS
jgi:predicted trehalose synthase